MYHKIKIWKNENLKRILWNWNTERYSPKPWLKQFIALNISYFLVAKNAFYLLDLMWLEGKIHLFPISSPYLFKSCDQELHSRVDYENVWTILSLTELLSISTISSFCENFILWNFKETLKDPGFTSVSSDILIKTLWNISLDQPKEADASPLLLVPAQFQL